jgi:two-component system response regulator MtrA
MTSRILLVEDDARLGEQVVETLRGAGHDVRWLRDGDEAMRAEPAELDLVVLDLMLPGAHGIEVLKRLRRSSGVPVLVLTAVSDAAERVRALALGADDVVGKPFWPEELLARVAARLRRPVLAKASRVTVGALALDLAARVVEAGGERVELTALEFDLLAALARRPGSAIARDWLVEHVLEPEHEGGDRTLDVHVSRLRKKLGAHAGQLSTVWGVGYRLDAAEPR